MRPTVQYDPVTGKPVFPWTARSIIIHDRWAVGACPCAFTGWAVGGACCSECAAGRECPNGGEVSGIFDALSPVQRGRPWSEVQTVNADIAKFQSDYSIWNGKQTSQTSFMKDWDVFSSDWTKWYAETSDKSLTTSIGLVGNSLEAFEKLETRWKALLYASKTAGVTTGIVERDSRSPVEQGLTEGAKKAAETAGKWGPWVLGGVALLVLGPMLLPAVGGLIAKKALVP